MEDECSYYHEQTITTMRSEEIVENQVERNEEQTEIP
jgi:hypothetical protein